MNANKSQTLAETVDLDLPEFDEPPGDPIDLLRRWLQVAREQGVREPGALALGTADSHRRSSSRIVQVSSITADGLLFTSHDGSQKGRDMAATKWASGVLYWRETSQQLTFAGPVQRLSGTESDALWTARPSSTHPMSVASRQSEPLEDEEALRAEAQRLADLGQPLPRPAAWSGYHLRPAMVEFWCGRPDRLHRRLRYDREGNVWAARRLQP